MTEAEEQESILNNLNKTRQLWNSKADLGTAECLVPKSPVSHTASSTKLSPSTPTHNGDITPTDIIRSEDQVIEDYELPDIKSIKSQWESPNQKTSSYVPLPSCKSPAAIAREKSIKKENFKKPPEPVNRDESANQDEAYEVELTKLKAQFESAAKAASKTRPKSPKTPQQNAAIKDQVTRSTSFKRKTARSGIKKLRFEDEMSSSAERIQTEERTESENISVDLSSLKTQFESRKDQNPVTPKLSVKRRQPEKVNSKRAAQPQSPVSSLQEETSSHSNMSESPSVELIKSSEPMYDEMIGEESVKDRLLKFRAMSESSESKNPPIKRKLSQKREATSVEKKVTESSEGEVFKDESTTDPEIVRSPPAGTRETPDYQPSVDLRQTKALFEKDPKPVTRSSSIKRLSTASQGSVESSRSSPRTGRSSLSGHSRSSSHHSRASSTSSKRSKSPSVDRNVTSSNPAPSNEENMSDVVKPLPAGTKETADYVPAVKVSSMKSMFEQSKSDSSSGSAPPPRRQLRDSDWANGNGEEAKRSGASDERVLSEGSYEDRGGVVRPPTAGTKERPSYNLSSDFLKSRAAMFEAPAPEQYTPRNKVNTKDENAPTEVVNATSEGSDLDYQLSSSLKDTKKMFEDGGASEDTSTTSKVPDDIVPAANLNSAKSVFENQQEETEEGIRKEPIDLQQESEEVQRREQEVAARETEEPEEPAQEPEEPAQEPEEPAQEHVQEPAAKPDSESETEGEYLLENNEAAPAEEQSEEAAAAVVPVRVAVPDTEENEDVPEEETQEEAPAQQEEVAQSDDAQPEDLEVEQQEVAEEAPNGVEEEQAADGPNDNLE